MNPKQTAKVSPKKAAKVSPKKTAKVGPKKTAKEQRLVRLIEETIAKGANTAEEINRAVLDLPISVLDSIGFGDTASEVKDVQDRTIGAVYELIHEINHHVADLASELLDEKSRRAR